jgi:hypothetical protein
MKITSIDYWRLHSLGQFENERIGLHAEVDPETENIFDCFKDLKATELSLQKEGLLINESKRVTEAEKPVTVVTGEKPTETQFNGLNWVTKTGQKGSYQQAENDKSENFRVIQQYIKDHKGFCNLYGWKVFFHFKNENLIDRKR